MWVFLSIGHVALHVVVRILAAANHKLQFKLCNYYLGPSSSPIMYYLHLRDPETKGSELS